MILLHGTIILGHSTSNLEVAAVEVYVSCFVYSLLEIVGAYLVRAAGLCRVHGALHAVAWLARVRHVDADADFVAAAELGRVVALLGRLGGLGVRLVVIVVGAGATATARGRGALGVDQSLLGGLRRHGQLLLGNLGLTGRRHLEVVARKLGWLVAHMLVLSDLVLDLYLLLLLLLIGLVYDKSALVAFVGLPYRPDLRALPRRHLLRLILHAHGRDRLVVHLTQVASRCLIECLVLLELGLQELAAHVLLR